jgi:hypothetical protein
LLTTQGNSPIQISKVWPATLRANTVEFIGQFHIQALRREPGDSQRCKDTATSFGFSNSSPTTRTGNGLGRPDTMDCIPSDVEHSPESKKDEDGLREDGEGTIETADLGLWDGFNGFVKALLILIC